MLEWYLNWYGYTNVWRPLYNADVPPVVSSTEVDSLLRIHLQDKVNQSVVFIGNSMGGLVGMEMHKFGWNIQLLITINSPLHGATLLHQIDELLPSKLVEICGGNSRTYTYLRNVGARSVVPPHPYKTISTNLPFLPFDGMVYEREAMLDPSHHTAIPWGMHHTVVLDPRIYWSLLSILQSE